MIGQQTDHLVKASSQVCKSGDPVKGWTRGDVVSPITYLIRFRE